MTLKCCFLIFLYFTNEISRVSLAICYLKLLCFCLAFHPISRNRKSDCVLEDISCTRLRVPIYLPLQVDQTEPFSANEFLDG